jgi:phospholipid/cholesterol/gamma-HCH transport system substrate-binding protein
MTTTSLDRPQTNTAKRNVAVGIFVLLGLVILAGGILAVGNIHSTFVPKITVTTSFADVNGLQPGNNVWFSGLKVGTVSNLEFVGESQVRVSLKIDKQTQRYVHKDAMAKLSSDGLIGNKIVVITSGTPGTPSIEDGDVLQTAVEPSTDDMLVMLQESNQDLRSVASDLRSITQQIASGQGTIGRLLYDDAMADSLSTTTASLAEASQKADKTAAALSNYTSNLNKPGTLLHDVAHDKDVYPALKKTSEGLAAASEDAAAAAAGLRAATTQSDSPMGVMLSDEEAAADLKATLANLETSSQALEEDLEAAQHAWPLRGGFKKKAKAEKKAAKEAAKADESAAAAADTKEAPAEQ